MLTYGLLVAKNVYFMNKATKYLRGQQRWLSLVQCRGHTPCKLSTNSSVTPATWHSHWWAWSTVISARYLLSAYFLAVYRYKRMRLLTRIYGIWYGVDIHNYWIRTLARVVYNAFIKPRIRLMVLRWCNTLI